MTDAHSHEAIGLAVDTVTLDAINTVFMSYFGTVHKFQGCLNFNNAIIARAYEIAINSDMPNFWQYREHLKSGHGIIGADERKRLISCMRDVHTIRQAYEDNKLKHQAKPVIEPTLKPATEQLYAFHQNNQNGLVQTQADQAFRIIVLNKLLLDIEVYDILQADNVHDISRLHNDMIESYMSNVYQALKEAYTQKHGTLWSMCWTTAHYTVGTSWTITDYGKYVNDVLTYYAECDTDTYNDCIQWLKTQLWYKQTTK